MKTFLEWVTEKHPESIEEGFFKNLALAGALTAGAVGASDWVNHPASNQTQDLDDEDLDGASSLKAKEFKLRAAAQKVGIPKSQWNNLKGRMIGGVVIVVNGIKVPLSPKESAHVKSVQELARRMGN